MKCPKCGYISFDFNQVCPKCSKDIGSEQAKLNLPSFRPEVPALLGVLIGEADDSGTDVDMGASAGRDTGEVSFDDSGSMDSGELSFEDSGSIDSGELSFEGSGSIDSGELTLEDSGDLDTGAAGFADSGDLAASLESEIEEPEVEEEPLTDFDSEELEPSVDEMEMPPGEPVTDFELESEEKTLSFEGGEYPAEGREEESAFTAEPVSEGGELELDLDDLSLEDSAVAEAMEMGEPAAEPEAAGPDLESLALELDETPPEAAPSEVEEEELALDLGDLKIDESGELQVEGGAEASDELEKMLEAAEISLDEAPSREETPEELKSDSGEMDIDLDALSADVEGAIGASEEDDELALDLDDLELELDLDEPKPKPS